MRFFWSRVECEAAVGSNVRSVPAPSLEDSWMPKNSVNPELDEVIVGQPRGANGSHQIPQDINS